MKQFRWLTSSKNRQTEGKILDVLLSNRGYLSKETIDYYLEPLLDKLYSPFDLPDMAVIIKRLKSAILSGELICIYGDYDVDGITSTSILWLVLKALEANVTYYIPNRFDEGYGINKSAIAKLAKKGVRLIITVDCGITALEEAAFAKTQGVDLIITDHHDCQEELPSAYALCNPKLSTSKYPFNMLAGAGIALKIAEALLSKDHAIFEELLCLAAVGTIADIAPLIDENRIIAKFGLAYLAHTSNIGLKTLIEATGLNKKILTAGHIGFTIGPRLNAVGRLENAAQGVELLTTQAAAKASQIVKELNALNTTRQQVERDILAVALKMIKEDKIHLSSGIIVVWAENWHHGVIGIVASRLSEIFYRPSIVLSKEGDILKGSARSIVGFSIFDALNSQKMLLDKFGGHQQAAGLSLKYKNLLALLKGLKHYCDIHLTERLLTPFIKIDKYLNSSDISHETLLSIDRLKPFGVANSKPIFAFENLIVDEAKKIGKDKNHLKIITNSKGRLLEALKFNYRDAFVPKFGERIDVAFTLTNNVFNGVESIQLHIEDLRSYHPYANEFNKKWFVYYVDALIEHIAQRGKIDLSYACNERRLSESALWQEQKCNIVVNSYEGLLELAYLYIDSDKVMQTSLEDSDANISLFKKTENPDLYYDLPLYSFKKETPVYYKDTDHSQLVKSIADIYFDRKRFAALYKTCLEHPLISVKDLLMHSDNILLDRVALAFFEEGSFINISAGIITPVKGKHHRIDFSTARIKKHLDHFTVQLYGLAKKIDSLKKS